MNTPALRRALLMAPLALAWLAGAGCESLLTGNEGNLLFSYEAVDELSDFNKPVAVGARLDLRVREAGNRKDVTIILARSGSPEALEVVDTSSAGPIVLEGRGDGTAHIDVRARLSSGETVDDSVDMLAREPEVLELRHVCSPDREAAYFVDTDVLVPFDMSLRSGKALVGYGLHPVDVEPASGLTFDESSKDQENFHVHTSATPGLVTLSSRIDSESLGMRLVRVGDVDGGGLSPASLDDTVPVDALGYIRMLPTVAGEYVCCPRTPMTVENDTPEICEIEARGESTCLVAGFVSVRGLAQGTCSFRASWAAADDGAGVEATATVPIVAPSTP
ncbi:MAG: hypothetical protein H6744_13925 [Deltaproteobacteria bacterium]|nr:hypothetical protein [Deltaproteobacteria bacterium]MCB9787776.1 hypothetical protein [Deltaproteobacteria bacterium]